MIKTSLGVEDKAFHGTGRKLGGAPTEVQPPSTHSQVCRIYTWYEIMHVGDMYGHICSGNP